MKRPGPWAAVLSCIPLFATPAPAQVERVWLTHRTSDPTRLVVNWTTKKAGDSKVRYGPTKGYGQEARAPGSRTLHHVEIPLPNAGTALHYSVSTGDQSS